MHSYQPVDVMLAMVDQPNYSACRRILDDNRALFEKVPGSSHNHQAWPGGYLDHVQETMNVAGVFYESLGLLRPLPFTLGDAPGGMQVTCAATPATVQPEPRVMRSRASAPTAGAIAGEVVADRVGRTKWERGDLLGTLVVEYDTPDGWAARGISFERLARAAWPADAAKHCDPQRL